MAVTPPFNPPSNTGPQITQAEMLQNQQGFNEALDKTVDLSEEIHEKLLDQVNAIKKAREETKNFYELKEKLFSLQEKNNKFERDQQSIIKDLSAQAKIHATEIKNGFEARRKQGEEIERLKNLQKDLTDLELSAIANTQEGINAKQKLQDKITDQHNRVLNLKTQELNLSKLLEKDGIKNLSNLKESEKLQLKKYIHSLKEQGEFKEYLKNHGINLELFEAELDAQEQMMTGYQKISQAVEFLNKKVETFKSTQVGKFLQAQAVAVGLTFGAILKNLLEYDKTITDAAKQLGISKDSLKSMASSMKAVANNAKEYNENAISTVLTVKNQLAAQQEINNSLGTANILTNQARVDQVVLTKQMGLQADEAAKLYKLGLLNDTNAKSVAKTVAEEVVSSKQKNKFQFDYKTVLNDVAKVEGQLAAQYKNNPKLLAEAVIQVRELGLEFNQAAGMANKLLDFETSIQSELKAELLTGKALNLERARELALRGESAAAAKELMDNVGGLEEFQNLNVIQQRALADAIGLSADELANSLKQQQLLAGTAFQTEKAFKEQAEAAARQGKSQEFINSLKGAQNAKDLMAQAQQISNQEKFQMAVEKLKETFVMLVDGPFGKIIDGFANIMSNAKVINTLIGAMALTMGASLISNTFKLVGAIKAAVQAEKSLAAAKAISLALSNPVAALAAVAVAGLAVAAVNSMIGGGSEGTSVSGGGGGGINVPSSTTAQSQNNNQPNKPLEVRVNNIVNIGGNRIDSVSNTQQKNSTLYDKTS